MKLLLGAGRQCRKGWTTVDANGAFEPDILAYAHDLPMIDTATVSEIEAVDVLEHISYRDTDRAIAEWARVICAGGRLFVQVPDADLIMRWYAADDERLHHWQGGHPCSALQGAQWRLLGGHNDGTYADKDGWAFNAHYALFSADKLAACLMRAGFHIDSMDTNGHPNLLARATRQP